MGIVSNFWLFFQNEILGMQWLNRLVGSLLTMFGMDIEGRVGASVQFFIYDVIKIFALLSVLIFIISYIQSFFPPQRTKQIIGRYKGVVANFFAALLGTVTPFCSCSSIPLFIGFTGAGVPVGVTFSFLISSPLVDLGAFVLLVSIFGPTVAIVYVIVGLLLAVVGGTLIEKFGFSKYVEESMFTGKNLSDDGADMSVNERVKYAGGEVAGIIKKVFWYVIGGVAIGAAIHNWIPQEYISAVLGDDNPFSVLIATVIGIPMYADIFGTIPIAEALFAKGVGIGTILSFMMAVTALSLPSLIMLRKAAKPKLLAFFIGIVSVGIVIIGYGFNFFYFL